MSEGRLIKPEDLGLPKKTRVITLKEAKENVEQSMIIEALERNLGNISETAQNLGITRPTLHELMKQHGLTRENFSMYGLHWFFGIHGSGLNRKHESKAR
jgi:two-component system NtrC family response regulator